MVKIEYLIFLNMNKGICGFLSFLRNDLGERHLVSSKIPVWSVFKMDDLPKILILKFQ